MNRLARFLTIILTTVLIGNSAVCDWTHYGRTPNRTSIALDGPDTIDENTLQWVAWEDPESPGLHIEFEGPGSPVLFEDSVYVYAKAYDPNDTYVASQIICFDAEDGSYRWHTIIDQAFFDSWSSPAVAPKNRIVVIGSDDKVFGIDCDTGAIVWSTQLDNPIVNASACIADDIAPSRMFITDFGDNSKLYCINLDD